MWSNHRPWSKSTICSFEKNVERSKLKGSESQLTCNTSRSVDWPDHRSGDLSDFGQHNHQVCP